MAGRFWHIIGAAAAAGLLALPASAADPSVSDITAEAVDVAVAGDTLRPEVAALIATAQAKLRAADILGAITDLDSAMARRPNPMELGVTLAVRGGALYAQGNLDAALADWNRAISAGSLDEATQVHLTHNIAQIEAALIAR